MTLILENYDLASFETWLTNFYRCTVHSLVYLTHQPMNIYTCYLINLKFTLKHLKRSYMFRSHDHPQGEYIFSC